MDGDTGDSCWGFIGYDYAKQELKDEFFGPAIANIRKGNPVQINPELTTE